MKIKNIHHNREKRTRVPRQRRHPPTKTHSIPHNFLLPPPLPPAGPTCSSLRTRKHVLDMSASSQHLFLPASLLSLCYLSFPLYLPSLSSLLLLYHSFRIPQRSQFPTISLTIFHINSS